MAEKSTIRRFASWEDLLGEVPPSQILEWVNELADKYNQQRAWGKTYRVKQQMIKKVVESMLDPDEMKRLNDEAKEIVLGLKEMKR